MLIRRLVVAAILLMFTGLCSLAALAQETPEEAKRRAAMEAERKADAENRKKVEDEIKRKEALGKPGTETDWDSLSATISGRVTDAFGIGVGNATITASWDQAKAEASTGGSQFQSSEVGLSEQDGNFRFILTIKLVKSVTSLKVFFTASHTDHLPGEDKSFTVQRESEVKDVELAMMPAGLISGTVTDADGRPVANATVTATSYAGPTERKAFMMTRKARTDAAGSYTIRGLKTEKYDLAFECPGYESAKRAEAVEVEAGEQTAKIDLTLAITEAITGSLNIDQMSDFRVGSASFYEGETCVKVCSVVIHDDKTFTIVEPPVGAWEFEFSWWRYQSVQRTAVTVTEDQHTDVGEIKVEAVLRELPND